MSIDSTSPRHAEPHEADGQHMRLALMNLKADDSWSAACPERVRAAFRSTEAEGWAAWKRHLRTRKRPRPIGKLVWEKKNPLHWSLTDGSAARGLDELLGDLEAISRKRKPDAKTQPLVESRLNEWLTSADRSDAYATEAVAWCYALPNLAAVFDGDLWWRAVQHMLVLADEAASLGAEQQPLAWQLLRGELPLALGYLFPEMAASRRLIESGTAALDQGFVDLLDGEGLTHARDLPIYRPLWGVWTRWRAIAEEQGDEGWQHAQQYRQLFYNVARLARHDAHLALVDGQQGKLHRGLVKTARRLVADARADGLARAAFGKATKNGWASADSVPSPADHSEWSQMGILRSGWSRRSPRLAMAYPSSEVLTELGLDGDVLWSGKWGLELRMHGAQVAKPGDWEEVCWVSDDDIDYFEIEAHLPGGIRIQRQCMLARKDALLFLADAVLGSDRGTIEYTGILPTKGHSHFSGASDTRDGWLEGRKAKVLVVPPALPEWRCDPRGGTLVTTERGLELRQSAVGTSLYAPLVLDLDRRRRQREITWRQLSVAENRELLPTDVAVGYRLQIGKAQWLFYRSLSAPGVRTVLGQNFGSEFYAGRFRRSGKVEMLVEIEPSSA